jgi:hypothetical protein
MNLGLPRIVGTVLTGLLLLAAATTHADAPISKRPAPTPAPYRVQVEDQWGNSLRTFNHNGRIYVMGDYGSAYQVRIRNNSGSRVEAVLSVDGRDAVSGAVADYRAQRGYIINAYDSITINGFRESYDNVRQFRFTNPDNSYSSRRGTPQYLGVIGVAFFPERVYQAPPRLSVPTPAPSPERYRAAPNKPSGRGAPRESTRSKSASSQGAPATAAPRAQAESSAADGYAERESRDDLGRASGTGNLGTEYGERSYNPVEEVAFVRQNSSYPRSVTRLYYDDESGLVARGIQVAPTPCYACYSEPNPFPAVTRFAPPP